MATSFLKKIILEEIRKVLKEQWVEDSLKNPGTDLKSSVTTAKAPKMWKSKKILELQKILKGMNMYDGPLDGQPGLKTKQAVGRLAGIKSKFISSKEIVDDIDSYIAAAQNYGNKNQGWASEEDQMAGAVASARKETVAPPTQYRKGEKSSELSATTKDSVPSKTEKLGKTRSTVGEEPNVELSDKVTTRRR